MIDKILKAALVLCILAVIFLASIMFFGCQSAPDRKDFQAVECFYFSDCLYRNQKNNDKSPCMILADACRDALKEQRTYERLKFCREKKPEGMSENECRLYINQK